MNKIIDHLSSYLSHVGHKELTLLLETICEFPEYRTYSRSNPFMQLLLRKMNLMKGMKIEKEFIFRFLNAMEAMKFPPLIICKYISVVLARKEK